MLGAFLKKVIQNDKHKGRFKGLERLGKYSVKYYIAMKKVASTCTQCRKISQTWNWVKEARPQSPAYALRGPRGGGLGRLGVNGRGREGVWSP